MSNKMLRLTSQKLFSMLEDHSPNHALFYLNMVVGTTLATVVNVTPRFSMANHEKGIIRFDDKFYQMDDPAALDKEVKLKEGTLLDEMSIAMLVASAAQGDEIAEALHARAFSVDKRVGDTQITFIYSDASVTIIDKEVADRAWAMLEMCSPFMEVGDGFKIEK